MQTRSDRLITQLREKAETLLATRELTELTHPQKDFEHLIHELQVYQAELEIQNEELRRTQHTLETSRQRLARLFHQAPVGYLILDADGLIVEANDTFSNLVARDAGDLRHTPFHRFIETTGRSAFIARYGAFFRRPEGKSLTLEMTAGGGAARHFQVEGRRVTASEFIPGKIGDDTPHLLLTLSDITDQKTAEAGLQRSNAALIRRSDELAAMVECTRTVLTNRDFTTTARHIFDAAKNVTGATAGYVALLNDVGDENELLFLDAGGAACTVDPELPMPVRGLRAEAYRDGRVVYDNDFADSPWMRYMPDGHAPLANVLFAPLILDGRTVGIMGLANKEGPFSERDARLAGTFGEFAAIALANSRNLESLDRERNRLAITLLSIGDGVIATDLDGRVELVNQVAASLTGWPPEEAVGRPVDDLFHIIDERTRERRDNPLARAIASGQVVQLANHTLLIARDGREYVIADSAAPIRDTHGDPIGAVLVFRDITETVQLQEQLSRSQKLESIGVLAGGIAHDFNNLLGIMMGNAELLREDLPADSPLVERVGEILTAGTRGRDVVRQLLSFTAKMTVHFKTVDVSGVVTEALRLLRATLPSNIEITTRFPATPARIMADPTQLQQALVNLCTNAGHAMEPGGGRLAVRIDPTHLDATTARQYPGLAPGAYIRLQVSDTGQGIAPEIRDQIFDPYFTTKDVGKGSGMGLTMVHGIVKNHDGAITVYSEPGKGSSFTMLFPAAASHASAPTPASPEPHEGRGERIMLVDDEAAIVRMEGLLLERMGYTVETFTSSRAALERFQAASDQIDLVITDMTMPQMTGMQLTREMRAIRPDVPVILCTGLSEGDTGTGEVADPAVHHLMKPVARADLAKAVHVALGKTGEGKPAPVADDQRPATGSAGQ